MNASLQYIKNVTSKLKIQTVVTILAVVFACLWLQQCSMSSEMRSELQYEKKKNDQNLAAMKEVLSIVNKQNGDIEASKAAYIGGLDEIKKYNQSMYSKFKDQEGLLAGIYSNLSIKLDSLISKGDKQVQYNDSTYGIKFTTEYSDSSIYNRIDGETKFMVLDKTVKPINTSIYSNSMRIDMTYGFSELDDRYEVFAVVKSKKIKLNELEGVFTLKKNEITPVKKLRWGIGAQLGATYEYGNRRIMPYVGLGLSYNIIRF